MTHGGPRSGAGRKPKAQKFARPVAAAEKKIADRLPELLDNLFALAAGAITQEWTAEGPRVYVRPPDRQANEYLINRIMGKPVERQEQVGADGGPVTIRHQIEDLRNMAPEDLIRIHHETLGDPEEDRQ